MMRSNAEDHVLLEMTISPEEKAMRARLGRAEKEVMRLSKELRKSNRACEKMQELVESLTARLQEMQAGSNTNKENQAGSDNSKENQQLAAENKALTQQRDHLLSRVAELERSRAGTPSNITAQETRGVQTETGEDDSNLEPPPVPPNLPDSSPATVPVEFPSASHTLTRLDMYSSTAANLLLPPPTNSAKRDMSPALPATAFASMNRGNSGRSFRDISKNQIAPSPVESSRKSSEHCADVAMSMERKPTLYKSMSMKKKAADGMKNNWNSTIKRTKTLLQLATAHGKTVALHDWRRDRDRINHRAALASAMCAVCGITGTLCTIAQHELILQGFDPQDLAVNILKGCNSLFTLLCIGMLIRYYWLMTIFERLRLLLDKRATVNDTSVSVLHVFSDRWLWLEILVVGVHLPPFITFEAGAYSTGNFILHRGESLDSAFSTIRLYLLGRVLQNLSLRDLPLRHTLSQTSNVHVGATFATKRMLASWRATLAVAGIWIFVLLVLAYIYRVGEVTGCALPIPAKDERCNPEIEPRSVLWTYDNFIFYEKVNDYYIQNAAWLMFVTGTTVGYGDTYPSTTWGRVIAALSALVGLILTALLTASLGNALQFSPEEHTALTLMTREKYKMKMSNVAARLLVAWWRVRHHKPESSNNKVSKLITLQEQKQEFRKVRDVAKADIEECAADQVKLRQMLGTLKYIQQSIDKVELNFALWRDESRSLVSMDSPLRLGAQARESSGFSIGMLNSFKQKSTISPSVGPAKALLSPIPLVPGSSMHMRETRVSSLVQVAQQAAQNRRRETRAELSAKLKTVSLYAAVGGFAGCFAAIVQDELIFREVRYDDFSIDVLKGFNSLTSILTAITITRLHWIGMKHLDAEMHLRLGKQEKRQEVSIKALFMRYTYWGELLICLTHLPPGITFELGQLQLDNYVVYRGETILALFNSLRMYLVLRVLKDLVLADLPKQHTIASYTGVKIGYRFAIKRVVGTGSIGVSWIVTLLFLALWFRSAERSACILYPVGSTHPGCLRDDAQNWTLYGSSISQNFGAYFGSALWHIFVSSTTVGYGDIYPVTHVGRTVSALAAIMGIIFVSILTASLTSTIAWTPSESETLRLLESRRVKLKLAKRAVHFIQMWWRAKQSAGTAHAQQSLKDVARGMEDFQWARKEATILSLHDHSTSSHQISKAFLLVRDLGDQLTELRTKMTETQSPLAMAAGGMSPKRDMDTDVELAQLARRERSSGQMKSNGLIAHERLDEKRQERVEEDMLIESILEEERTGALK